MRENRQRKVLLKVGYACNNRCVFCHSEPYRSRTMAPAHELVAKIRAARVLGFEMVVLSGGEPTLHPELSVLLREIRSQGLALGFVTNARRMAHPRFVEGLVRHGLGYVYMSLHGAVAATHNRHAGDDTFRETLAALDNLAAVPDLHHTVNAVVTAWNAPELAALADLVLGHAPARVKFSFLEPKGAALSRLAELQLAPAAAAARVREALTAALPRAQAVGGDVAWDALPFCLMDGWHGAYDDLLTNAITTMSEAFEADFFPVDHGSKQHAPACADCALVHRCPGLWQAARERFGDGFLAPYPAAPEGYQK